MEIEWTEIEEVGMHQIEIKKVEVIENGIYKMEN